MFISEFSAMFSASFNLNYFKNHCKAYCIIHCIVLLSPILFWNFLFKSKLSHFLTLNRFFVYRWMLFRMFSVKLMCYRSFPKARNIHSITENWFEILLYELTWKNMTIYEYDSIILSFYSLSIFQSIFLPFH